MYRIQLSPGTETTYQTIDEFIRAVTVGEVTPESLIFHRKSERWLPVTRHPHYQHALSVQPAPASRPRPAQALPRGPEGESPPAPGARTPRQLQIPRVDNAVQPRKVFPANGQDQKVEASELDQLLSLLGSPEAPSSGTKEQPPAASGPAAEERHGGINGNGPGPSAELSLPEPPPEAAPPPPPPAPPASAQPPAPVEPPPTAAAKQPSPPPVESRPEMPQPEPVAEPPHSPSGKTPNLPRMEPPAPERLDVVADLAPVPDARPAEPVTVERVEHSRRVAAPRAVPAEIAEPIRSGGRRSIAKAAAAAVGLALAAATLMVWRPWDRSGAQATEAPPPEQHASLAGSESRQQAETPLSGAPAPRRSLPADSARVAVPAPAGTPPPAVAPAPTAATDSLIARPQILPPTANALTGTAAMTANLSGLESRLPLSPAELKRHYVASYGALRQALETAGTRAGFSQLLTPQRMGSGDALKSSRQSLTAAGIAIREYRSGESRTERAYQDTLALVGKRLGLSAGELTAWGPNPTLKEDGETARLVDVMMAQADGIFGLLLTQQGQYQFSGDAIVFTDSETARRYALLRSTLVQQVQRWSETPANRVPVTVAFLLQGLGKVQLPAERSATP